MTGLTTRENDFVKNMIMTSTHDYLMFFTNTGKAHKIKAYEIPEATRTAKGTPAVNFLNLMQRERITAVIPIQEFAEDKYLIARHEAGHHQKDSAFCSLTRTARPGLIAMNLKDGDELIGIKQTSGTNNVIIVTKHGQVHLLLRGRCASYGQDRRRRQSHQA